MLLKSIQLTYKYFLPANVIKINNDIFSIKNVRYNLVLLQTDYTTDTQNNFSHYLLSDSSLDKVLQTLTSEGSLKLTSKENLRECKINVKFEGEKEPFKTVFFFLALLKHDLTHFIILKSELTDKEILTKNLFLSDHWTKEVNAVKISVPVETGKKIEPVIENEKINPLPLPNDVDNLPDDKLPVIDTDSFPKTTLVPYATENMLPTVDRSVTKTQPLEQEESEDEKQPEQPTFQAIVMSHNENLHTLIGTDVDTLQEQIFNEYNLQEVDYKTGYKLKIYDKNNFIIKQFNVLLDESLNLEVETEETQTELVENENQTGTDSI